MPSAPKPPDTVHPILPDTDRPTTELKCTDADEGLTGVKVLSSIQFGGLVAYNPDLKRITMKALFYVAVALGLTNPKKLTRAYQAITPGGQYGD